MARAGFVGRMGPVGGRVPRNWSFANGLPYGATFTRASSANDFNASGVLTSYGNDVPAYGYNAATGAFKGILLEPAATNLVSHSNIEGQTYWAVARLTENVSSERGLFINRMTLTTETGRHEAFAPSGTRAVVTTGVVHTISQVLGYNGTAAKIQVCASQGATLVGATLDIETGTIVASGSTNTSDAEFISSSVEELGSGLYRVSIVAIPKVNTTFTSNVSFRDSATFGLVDSYAGDGIKSAKIGHHSIEVGSKATSMITSINSTVTRQQPNLTLSLPYQANNITLTFDNDTTQTFTNVAASYAIPVSSLNRTYVKSYAVVPYV